MRVPHGPRRGDGALLAADGIDTNDADIDGDTALALACQAGHTEVVRALLAVEGIDVADLGAGVLVGLLA